MPLYEYECGACGHRFEIIQKFSDQPITECPKCRGALRKLQSAPAFQLKGTGWYATDYPKTGQAPADKDSGGSSDSSSGDKVAAKGDKSEKTEKSDKPDKPDTTEKKTERTEKTDTTKSVKSEVSSPKKTDRGET
jgi:putative FmdB family regulatory protein